MKRMGLILIVLAAVIIVTFLGVGLFSSARIDDSNYRKGQVLIGENRFEVLVAETTKQRVLGLGGREELAEREGMLFPYELPAIPSFWMKGMKMPIDIIWISGDRVIGFAEEAQPAGFYKGEMFRPGEPVTAVLEVRMGTVEDLNIRKGDEVEINLGEGKGK